MSSLITQNRQTKTINWLISLVAGSGLMFAVTQLSVIPAQAAGFSAGEVYQLSNNARAANGVGALNANGALSQAAYAKAQDMFANNYWAHTSPSGVTGWYFIQQAGYSYSNAGENLAQGYGSASAVVSAWLASPSHRENLLNGNFTDTGIAVVSGTLGGQPTILVVAMYGRPYGYVAPAPPAPAAAPAPGGGTASPVSAPSQADSAVPTPPAQTPDVSNQAPADQAPAEQVTPSPSADLSQVVQTIKQAPSPAPSKSRSWFGWLAQMLKFLHI